MLTLERELETLRPILGDAAADALIARERREIFSIYPELRFCGWLGAAVVAAAAGILLKNNLDRIGPVVLAIGVGAAAAACYAFVGWRRGNASVVDDYVLLLGALLVSADVAFIESQFHLLDDAWKHHLLLLAVVHAAGAYAFGSRMLLSLSISALAGWLGVDRHTQAGELAFPAFICAAILLAWRAIDLHLPPTANRQPATFSRTFEHFAANIALFGAFSLMIEDHSRVLGASLAIAIAAAVILWGFRVREEWFVLYAVVYAVIAIDTLLIDVFDDETAAALIVAVSMIGAIVSLLALHARFKEARR